MERIVFSVDLFRKNGVHFPSTFKMRESVDYRKMDNMERNFSGDSIKLGSALKRIKDRTSINYFNNIQTAQADAQYFAINTFPAYRMLLPDVLMDDWLSIVCPHQEHKRDHSFHQHLTAYIVSELLVGGDSGKGLALTKDKTLLDECARMLLEKDGTKYLRDYYASLYPRDIPEGYYKQLWAKEVFYHTAIIAALFHDIGYPWQFLNKVGGSVELVNKEGGLIHESVGRSIFDYIEKRLLVYPFYGYSETPRLRPTAPWDAEVVKLIDDAYRNTHGFPGSLAFMYLNDSVRKFMGNLSVKQANIRFIQDWASVGIMMHDMVRQYYGKKKNPDQPRFKLSMDKDPLSCIIGLADVLEEFGRPMAKFNVGKNSLGVSFDDPCKKTEINIDKNTLRITYYYSSVAEKIKNEERRKKEIDDYFRTLTGYIDLSAIGIDKVLCDVRTRSSKK